MSKTKTRAEIQFDPEQAKMRIAELGSNVKGSEKRFASVFRVSEKKYGGIFDGSIVVTCFFYRGKYSIASNQAGRDLLGYSHEEPLHMSIPDVNANPVAILSVHAELFSGGRLVSYEYKLQ